MPSNSKLSRRTFLAGAAAAATPLILPEGVLARNGKPGANDRIVVANIGVGGMGRNHVAEDCAAICDVDWNHITEAAKQVKQGTPARTKTTGAFWTAKTLTRSSSRPRITGMRS